MSFANVYENSSGLVRSEPVEGFTSNHHSIGKRGCAATRKSGLYATPPSIVKHFGSYWTSTPKNLKNRYQRASNRDRNWIPSSGVGHDHVIGQPNLSCSQCLGASQGDSEESLHLPLLLQERLAGVDGSYKSEPGFGLCQAQEACVILELEQGDLDVFGLHEKKECYECLV